MIFYHNIGYTGIMTFMVPYMLSEELGYSVRRYNGGITKFRYEYDNIKTYKYVRVKSHNFKV